MTIQTRMSYPEMIFKLFKRTGYDSGSEALMHASVGIVGESVELMFSDSAENMVEEFGDLEFYVEAAVQSVSDMLNAQGTIGTAIDSHLVREKFDLLVVEHMTQVEEVTISDLVYFSNEVLDIAKKLWVYKKPLLEVQDKLIDSLANLKAHMLALYADTHLSEEIVRGMNQDKLVYSENARFKDAAYSDAAAQARADKAAGE